ncbi:glucokinase [Oceanicola sp. 502str15]|uniref:glucokinase n=1 Tax=Oceanicola sp. 502str15 TaxID=2696061 RepID=UPI0020957EC0|nr:glucokinase [Oceanicola sp. 502str15]MCO6381918.1 glucokinase [Oceanicola sp. 502str15]
MTHTALIADIGGTNTRLALAHGPELDAGSIMRFRNAEFADFEAVVAGYLPRVGTPQISGACVAAAGPVVDGVAELTNIDWVLDIPTIARAAGTDEVALLNDLQAPGHAIGRLAPEGLETILPAAAPPAPGATGLVVNVGTGFNAVPVHSTPTGRLVPASESGHVNLPIRTEADLRLSHYVDDSHGFPAVEEVLSGRGLENVYRWHCAETGAAPELRGSEIIAAAEAGRSPQAGAAVQTFLRFLGTVTGNLALEHLPFGGIYLVGGVATGLGALLKTGTFAAGFRDKGRFAGFMEDFPVTLVRDDRAPLIGCANHLHERRTA